MAEAKKPIKPWQEKTTTHPPRPPVKGGPLFNPDYEKEEESEKKRIPPNIAGTVREEFAKAKARAFGKKPTMSPLEEAALEWQKRKEKVIQEWEGKREGPSEVVRPWTGGRIVSQEKPTGSFKEEKLSGPLIRPWEGGRLTPDEKSRLKEMFASQVAKVKERKEDRAAVSWEQYSPWEKEKEKKPPRRLNMVTIHALARKIIAQEWRRIRGRPEPDPRAIALEREAVTFQERRLEEKLRKEEEQKKIEEMVKRYQSQLQTLVNSLQAPQILKKMEAKTEETLKAGPDIELFKSVLEEVGRIESLKETEEGFLAEMEPWHEMKMRMMQLEQIPPQLCEIKINKNFELESFIPQDPELAEEKRIRVYKATLEEALKGIQEMKEPEGGAPKLELEKKELEKELELEPPGLFKEALSKVGRIIAVSKTNEGWSALIEPWEEMKQRIMEKKEEPFIYNVRVNNDLQLISYLPLGYQAVEKVQSK